MLAALLAAIAILAVHAETASSIVAIWIRSETFAHGFVVVPISLWLIWRRRDELAMVPARPWWPGLAVIAGAGAFWLAASAAYVLSVRQFALAFMVIGAIVTVIGLRAARAMLFPLAFLLFAVPAGEFLVPTLIEWTADFTVLALRASGVPTYREANHLMVPSGAWSVVEACSGVRYLIASVMVGTIYAAVAYTSTRRRVVFVVASILVPILANWLRAYMIVMVGHLSNNRFAAGVDHIIYGWVFFGIVMLLLFWVGSFWQESAPATPAVPVSPAPPAFDGSAAARDRTIYAAAIAAVAVAAVWQPIETGLRRSAIVSTPTLPAISGTAAWQPSAPFTTWKPHYKGFVAEQSQSFRAGDREVGLYVAYYRNQEKRHELITSGNLLVAREDWAWKHVASGRDRVDWTGRATDVDRAEILGTDARLQVFDLYWVDGRVTSNPYVAKALLAWSRLTGRGDDSALIVAYTPERSRDDASRQALRDFLRQMSPEIESALGRAREAGR